MDELLKECQTLLQSLQGGAIGALSPREALPFSSFEPVPVSKDRLYNDQEIDITPSKDIDWEQRLNERIQEENLNELLVDVNALQIQSIEEELAHDSLWINSGIQAIKDKVESEQKRINETYRTKIKESWLNDSAHIRKPFPSYNAGLVWMTQFRDWFHSEGKMLDQDSLKRLYQEATQIIRETPFLHQVPVCEEWIQFQKLVL